MSKNKDLIPDPRILLEKTKKDSASFIAATKEAKSVSEEELEKVARTNEHKRREYVKQTFFVSIIWIMRALLMGVMLGIIFIFWHWLSPAEWHFLSETQIENLKTMAFSVLGTNAFKEFYKKFLDYL